MQHKRSFVLALVVVLVISSLGVLTASAATAPAERAAQSQDDSPTPWLGVLIATADNGVTVEQVVADSPAESAGLEVGDTITAVDDTAIESADQLVELVQEHAVGDELTLTVLSDGEESTVTVTLAERPAESDLELPDTQGHTQIQPYVMQGIMNLFGVTLEMSDDGLLVKSIDDDSPLAESDLQTGDLITAINGEAIADLGTRDMLRELRGDEPLTLTVLRDGEEIEITLDVSDLSGWMGTLTPDSDTGSLHATTQPTQLGVYYQTITADIAAEQDLTVDHGALIQEVINDTPAAEAGLQAGDIVLAVDGDIVDEERTLPDRLYAYEEGDVVTLTVLRDGEEIEIEVTLGPRATNMFGDGFGMFSEDFLNNHPFMQDFLDEMPESGFQFHFGPGDSTPDQGDSNLPDENNTNA